MGQGSGIFWNRGSISESKPPGGPSTSPPLVPGALGPTQPPGETPSRRSRSRRTGPPRRLGRRGVEGREEGADCRGQSSLVSSFLCKCGASAVLQRIPLFLGLKGRHFIAEGIGTGH